MAVLPASAVTISEVASALGTTSKSLTTLCKSDAINQWSKNKPIAYNTLYPITQSQRQEKNWGLTGNSAHTAPNMILLVDAANGVGVEYAKPTGKLNSPCRLGDFRGYYHQAMNPCESHFSSNTTAFTSSSWDSFAPKLIADVGNENQIYLKDIYGKVIDDNGEEVKELNYGVAIMLTSTTAVTNSSVKWSVGGIPWNESTWKNTFNNKWCYVYEFLTNMPSGRTSATDLTQISDVFLPLPQCRSKVYFQTSSTTGGTSQEFSLGAKFNSKLTSVLGTITVSSKDTSTATYTGGTITMMRAELLTASTAISHIGYTYIINDNKGETQFIGPETAVTLTCTITPTLSTVILTSCYVRLTWKTESNKIEQSQVYAITTSIDPIEPLPDLDVIV